MATVEQDHRERARRAIEEVCARGDFDKAPQFYSERFHDHVNSLEYHGLEGVRQSVELYRMLLACTRVTPVFPVPVSAELAALEHGDLGIAITLRGPNDHGISRARTMESPIGGSFVVLRQLRSQSGPPAPRFRAVRVPTSTSSTDGLLR